MRETFIDKILKIENIRLMKKWSERNKSSGYHSVLLKKIITILELISGNETDSLLKDLLKTRKIESEKDLENANTALKHISDIYKDTKPKKKYQFIRSMRLAGFGFDKTNFLGFKTGKFLWKTCLDPSERSHGGRLALKKQEIYQQINDHMNQFSSIAANRFLIKDQVNAFHRETSFSEAYNLFIKSGKKVSYTAFIKNTHRKYKKFRKATDLCQYCEHGKFLAKEIKAKLSDLGYEEKEVYHELSLENVKALHIFLLSDTDVMLPRDEINIILKKIFDLKEVALHRILGKTQRDCYNHMREDKVLLDDKILIVIDFKAKIKLAQGPRQLNNEFYEANSSVTERLLLSFGIYYLDAEEIKCLNADLILNDCTENAFTVINSFKFLRTQSFFKQIEKKNYIIWYVNQNFIRFNYHYLNVIARTVYPGEKR